MNWLSTTLSNKVFTAFYRHCLRIEFMKIKQFLLPQIPFGRGITNRPMPFAIRSDKLFWISYIPWTLQCCLELCFRLVECDEHSRHEFSYRRGWARASKVTLYCHTRVCCPRNIAHSTSRDYLQQLSTFFPLYLYTMVRRLAISFVLKTYKSAPYLDLASSKLHRDFVYLNITYSTFEGGQEVKHIFKHLETRSLLPPRPPQYMLCRLISLSSFIVVYRHKSKSNGIEISHTVAWVEP